MPPTSTMRSPEAAVAASFEARIRDLRGRAPLAARHPLLSRRSARREEAPCRLRTPFQRDRDRIVHSKSFRRLKHKTQVFIAPEGDHYRTRLTHTLEACGISRTVARALRLNEDLTEAIGLGHDLGHPPFGHAGEEALDRALHERFGRRFRHNEHSLRVVDVLERDGRGPQPHRAGARRHPAPHRARTCRPRSRAASCGWSTASPTSTTTSTTRCAPACCAEGDLPREEIAILGETGSERIDLLVHDLVEHSERAGDIVQGEEVGGAMARLRKFMFDHVYLGEAARREQERVTGVMRRAVRPLRGDPGRRAGARAGRRRRPRHPRHRLPRRHDRPLLHPRVRAPHRAARVRT